MKASTSGRSLRLLIGLACFVVVAAGIQAAAQILVPFLLSVFIAVSCAPLLAWLQKRGLPMWVAIILIMIVISTGVFLIAGFVGSSMTEFTRRLPDYQIQLVKRFADSLHAFEKFGIDISADVVLEYFDPRGFSFACLLGIYSGPGGYAVFRAADHGRQNRPGGQ